MAKRKTARPYTDDEYRRFKRLVEMGESRVQMQRIESRLAWPKFIAEVGQEKCEIMFARLCGKRK